MCCPFKYAPAVTATGTAAPHKAPTARPVSPAATTFLTVCIRLGESNTWLRRPLLRNVHGVGVKPSTVVLHNLLHLSQQLVNLLHIAGRLVVENVTATSPNTAAIIVTAMFSSSVKRPTWTTKRKACGPVAVRATHRLISVMICSWGSQRSPAGRPW
ncbi:unnamed protein product [Gadus morhua 'NCC']